MFHTLSFVVLLVIVTKDIHHILAYENIHIYQALILIIKQTFMKGDSRLSFYVNFNSWSKTKLFYVNDFLNALLLEINNATYNLMYQRKKVFLNLKHNEVLIFDNLVAFRYFYEDFYNVGNINLSHTILYISSIKTLDFETISSVFKDLYHMGILNLALIIKLAPDNIVMLTYFPFTPTSCHDIKPVIINRYLPEQQRWTNFDYFPEKLKDFYGCPLTCCAWLNMPYFSVNYDARNGRITDYHGLEAEILKFAVTNKNISIKIQVMTNEVPKAVYNEGSIFAKIFSETCDLALGGFAYKNDLNSTSPLSQTNFFFLSNVHLVTNTLSVYSTYEKLAFPFHYIVWYTLGFILTMSSLLIYICERWPIMSKSCRPLLLDSTTRTPHFNLYAVSVGANITNAQLPKRNFPRFLLTCWVLAALVLRSAYQSGTYQMLRDKTQKNLPQTIEQVFKQNYLISMTPENRRYLPILPEVKRMRIFNTTILPSFPELLKAKEPTAFITPYEYFGYFGKVNVTQWQNLHMVAERLVQQQLTIYVRHHSYLIHELNEQIADAQYYGFTALWNRKYVKQSARVYDRSGGGGAGGGGGYGDGVNTDDDYNCDNNNLELSVLSMNELGAMFMILISFHVISTLVLVGELAWHKYEQFCMIKK